MTSHCCIQKLWKGGKVMIYSVKNHVEPLLIKYKELTEMLNDHAERILDDDLPREERKILINEFVVNTIALSAIIANESKELAVKSQD